MADLPDLTIKIDASEAEATLDRLQAKADTLLATLEKCSGACESCALTVGGTLKRHGADLVAIIRETDYRTGQTEVNAPLSGDDSPESKEARTAAYKKLRTE